MTLDAPTELASTPSNKRRGFAQWSLLLLGTATRLSVFLVCNHRNLARTQPNPARGWERGGARGPL